MAVTNTQTNHASSYAAISRIQSKVGMRYGPKVKVVILVEKRGIISRAGRDYGEWGWFPKRSV